MKPAPHMPDNPAGFQRRGRPQARRYRRFTGGCPSCGHRSCERHSAAVIVGGRSVCFRQLCRRRRACRATAGNCYYARRLGGQGTYLTGRELVPRATPSRKPDHFRRSLREVSLSQSGCFSERYFINLAEPYRRSGRNVMLAKTPSSRMSAWKSAAPTCSRINAKNTNARK